MNNIYLRSNNNLKKIVLRYIIALLPLIVFGFYKNGIKLYINSIGSIYTMFKPLLLDLIGFIIGILVNIIYNIISKKEVKEAAFESFYPLYGLLIASVISINTNIILFIIVTFIILFISKFFKTSNINIVALTALIIIFITNLLGDFTFLNSYEQANILTLNSLDYLIGKGSGGINTTHIFFLVVSLILLCTQSAYKKEIPLFSTIIYIICITIYSFVINDIGEVFDKIFTNGILFSYIFIATDSLSSSYTQKGKIIYSFIIGLATFGLYLIYPPLSALGGILIASICHSTIDKICER